MTSNPGTPISRRTAIAGVVGAAITACTSSDSGEPAGDTVAESTTAPERTESTTTAAPTTTEAPRIDAIPSPAYAGDNPFVLGIASGDPDETSVVLWTRLVANDLALEQDVAVDVATDDTFTELVSSSLTTTTADHAHSAHVIAAALEPNSWYSYRFRVGDHTSPVGRSRTTPRPGQESPMRLGFSSCQNWESGGYAAHRHLAEADLDLFVWLGDYIYEYGPGNRGVVSSAGLREHDSPEVTDLAGYRGRYALYKSDPALQSHHAARPWAVTWDDHEIDNNHAGLTTEDGQEETAFLERRRAAHQAWWEHMPVRLDPPSGDTFRIHRSIHWGETASIHLLDGRQYRDPQPTDGDPVELGGVVVQTLGPTANDPAHTMLGTEQESWLIDAVDTSPGRWQVLGNQVYMHGLNALPGEVPTINTDSWDGYHGSRRALLEALAGTRAENLVVLTGDFHAASVGDVHTDPFDRSSPVVATEFMAPAISSTFPASLRPLAPLALAVNPQIRHFDPDNGFMTCVVDGATWTTELHILDDVTDEASGISVRASFAITNGTAGVA
ncbi:MAG: alkaline phosphatase D family protein [Acidimicrobiales bacterium]